MHSAWNLFVRQIEHLPTSYNDAIEHVLLIRDHIVNGQPIGITEKELLALSIQLNQITQFVHRHGFVIEILPVLKRYYAPWLRPEIRSVQVIRKNKSLFLEISRGGYKARVDINFYFEEDSAEEGSIESKFPLNQTDQENAEWFIKHFNFFTSGTYPEIFTSEGSKEIMVRWLGF